MLQAVLLMLSSPCLIAVWGVGHQVILLLLLLLLAAATCFQWASQHWCWSLNSGSSPKEAVMLQDVEPLHTLTWAVFRLIVHIELLYEQGCSVVLLPSTANRSHLLGILTRSS